MEKPRLILRFRDVMHGVDTIREHQKIINGRNYVYWGWWKKDSEPEQSHLFQNGPGNAYALDSEKKKLYIITYADSFLGSELITDENLVPEYYRKNIDQVAGWFRLTFIEEVEYEDDLEYLIGQRTLVQNKESFASLDSVIAQSPKRSSKSSILHLSDLHFGNDHGFNLSQNEKGFGVRKFSEVLLDDLHRIDLNNDIEAIVITGDLTTKGDWSDKTKKIILEELGIIMAKLNVDKERVYIAPGNHDIVRYQESDERDIADINVELQTTQAHEQSLRIFIEQLTGRHWGENLDYKAVVSLKEADVNILILNSCRVAAEGKWTEYGFVGSAGLSILNSIKSEKKEIKTFSIMALHHHLLPVNQVDMLNEKGVSLTIDAIQLLDKASEVGVDIALHGHQHCSRVSRYQKVKYEQEELELNPITIVSSGSGGVDKSRRIDSMKNSYSVVTCTGQGATLTMREISNDGIMHSFLYKNVPVRG
ncbi:metallophosphoesterase [Vibrio harveyi]|nr:metallophosphoesterase [Vibrio harveyi]